MPSKHSDKWLKAIIRRHCSRGHARRSPSRPRQTDPFHCQDQNRRHVPQLSRAAQPTCPCTLTSDTPHQSWAVQLTRTCQGRRCSVAVEGSAADDLSRRLSSRAVGSRHCHHAPAGPTTTAAAALAEADATPPMAAPHPPPGEAPPIPPLTPAPVSGYASGYVRL